MEQSIEQEESAKMNSADVRIRKTQVRLEGEKKPTKMLRKKVNSRVYLMTNCVQIGIEITKSLKYDQRGGYILRNWPKPNSEVSHVARMEHPPPSPIGQDIEVFSACLL